MRRLPSGGTVHIEDIQDQVELALMRSEHHKVARAYVLYREEHARLRSETSQQNDQEKQQNVIYITAADGSRKPLDIQRLKKLITEACTGLNNVDQEFILQETFRNLFDGVPEKDIIPTVIMSTRTQIEKEPDYSFVSARLLLDNMRSEALTFLGQSRDIAVSYQEMTDRYGEYFGDFIRRGAELELLDCTLTQYDLVTLGKALKPERDLQFNYLGLQTLYDRYFIHHNDTRFELPQAFFMRVAMGLAINELNRVGVELIKSKFDSKS